MTVKSLPLALLLSTTALAAACSPPPEDEALSQGQQALSAADAECPYCTGNAATVGDKVIFDDMHIDPLGQGANQPNVGGVTVMNSVLCTDWSGTVNGTGTCQASEPVRLSVEGDKLVGRSPEGSDLTGALPGGLVMTLRHTSGKKYQLFLKAAKKANFWVKPATFHVYDFVYRPLQGTAVPTDFKGARHLCTGEYTEAETRPYAAALYAGERHDSRAKTVRPAHLQGTDRGWFAVACFGTALAKMHYLRKTAASRTTSYIPGADQAFLKMLTADYCGDGLSDNFTYNGHPLLYHDFMQVKSPGFPDVSTAAGGQAVEAVWTAGGASCLNTPREVDRQTATKKCPALPSCPPIISVGVPSVVSVNVVQ